MAEDTDPIRDYLADYYGPAQPAGTPYPESGTEQPTERSRPMGELRAYNPTRREQLAQWIAGQEESSPFRQLLAQRLLGTTGLPSSDPNKPWRALPVAAPAIDAYAAAEKDQHGPFALHALDAGLEAFLLRQLLGGPAKEVWAQAIKPPLPAPQGFSVPIKNPGTGENVGYVGGQVAGDRVHIGGAYRDAAHGVGRKDANSIGYREMRRVFDAIRERFPHTARVTAHRVSGARTGPVATREGKQAAYGGEGSTETLKQRLWKSGGPMDEVLSVADRATKGRLGNSQTGEKLLDAQESTMQWARRHNLDIETTPLWRQILNEAGKRGVR